MRTLLKAALSLLRSENRMAFLNLNKNHYILFCFIWFLYPIDALASDFAILQVGLGSLVIAGALIFSGIKAFTAKTRQKRRGYLTVILILTLIGVALVMDESGHMARSDFWGMLGTIVIPGFFAFILPLAAAMMNRNKKKR